MIKINKSPVLTSKNYGINFTNINQEDICNNIKNFNDYKITNKNVVKESNIDKVVTQNLLGKVFDAQSKQYNNSAKKYTFSKSNAQPLVIDFNLSSALVDDLEINVEKNVHAKAVLKYLSNQKAYHNGLLKINLKDNAVLDIYTIYAFDNATNNFVNIQSNQKEYSKLNIFVFDCGCKNTVQNICANIVGNNANIKLNSLYFGAKNENLSLNYLFNIKGKFANCNMNVCGVLNDKAQKNFIGTIDFYKGSKKSIGQESEYCMMLSDKVKATSTPILLCKEEDVDGRHASAVGKINQEELFYCMSRGLNKLDAQKLLIKAKLFGITKHIQDDNLKNYIEGMIDDKIKEN